MKHKLTATLTALAMLCGTVPAVPAYSITAQAEEYAAFRNGELVPSGTISETLTYTIEDGTLTISGTGMLPDSWYEPLMPNNADSWRDAFKDPVRAIVIEPGVTYLGRNAFSRFRNVVSVSIPDTVTGIGDDAFFGCPALREIRIPDSVTQIGDYALAYCTALTSVTVPDRCLSIGEYAFIGCTSLTDVKIPVNLQLSDPILKDTPWLKAQQEKDPLVLLNGSVQDGTLCKGEVVIPEGTRLIAKAAFSGCEDITAVTVPESIDRIPQYAFTGCRSLQSVTILNPYCRIDPTYVSGTSGTDSRTICNSVEPDDSYSDGWDHYKITYTGVIRSYEGSDAQKFAEKYGYTFESLGIAPELAPGDLDADTNVNASDAAAVLIASAAIGADADSGLTGEQLTNADVNHDGDVNASDAALILNYAAFAGAMGYFYPMPALQSYLYELDGTAKRVAVWKDDLWAYDRADPQVITSPEELQAYFTDYEPRSINNTDWLMHLDPDTLRAELAEAYPASFFETHHLAALSAQEGNSCILQEIRKIEPTENGVTIRLHHNDGGGEPTMGFFIVLVAVDKSIADASQITVKETRSSRLYLF